MAGTRPVLLTGDARDVAANVARATGIADVHAEATPEDKARIVGDLRRSGEVVVMVGDGLNDAPALAAADVGVALGANGSTISSDAADAVVLVDDLGRVADAIEIGRETLAVARTGIFVGMGLSAVLMVVAAFGGIAPLARSDRAGGDRRRGHPQRSARTRRPGRRAPRKWCDAAAATPPAVRETGVR